MKLIDGDRLIEWLEANERNGRVLNLPDVRFIVTELAKDINVPTNGWISVKDRLPKNTNHVLALCEVRHFKKLYKCIAMYVRPHEISEGKYPEDDTFFDYDEDEDEYYLKPGWYEIGRNFGEYGSAVIEDFVTHWRPLPEPPEEEA